MFDGVLWGDPGSTADLPLSGDLTVDEMQAIRAGLIQALQEITGADRVTEPGTVFNPDTPFETVRDEFNRLLRPVRNAQGQINDAAEDYQDEIADLNPLLAQIRSDPTLAKLCLGPRGPGGVRSERAGPGGRGGRRAGRGGCAGAAAKRPPERRLSSRASVQKSAALLCRRRGEDGQAAGFAGQQADGCRRLCPSRPCSPSSASGQLYGGRHRPAVRPWASPHSRWAARAGR